MCFACNALNVPVCAAGGCNPTTVVEGASFVATKTSTLLPVVVGSITTSVLSIGLWLKEKRLRLQGKKSLDTKEKSSQQPK